MSLQTRLNFLHLFNDPSLQWPVISWRRNSIPPTSLNLSHQIEWALNAQKTNLLNFAKAWRNLVVILIVIRKQKK